MIPETTAPTRIFAGIDIGTLTCRLLIAELTSAGGLRELRSDRRILRLGQGVDRERVLRPDAMARVVATLKEWRQVIDGYHVDAATAVATSAVRDAGTVSYTHLTLPTVYSVSISVVAVSLKKKTKKK